MQQIPKIAVGYVRCSTEQQEDSPDQQKKEILAFAERVGYKVIDWYIDFGKSGTSFEQRSEFQRLREQVDSDPQFEAVICYDESRWGRAIDAEENTYWRVHFRKRGVEVVLVKTSVDRNNEFAPMLSAFEGVQASQYSKKLSELTLRGAKNNGIYSSGGQAPYGYKRIAVNSATGTERELGPGEWCVSGKEKVRWGLGSQAEVDAVRYIFEERSRGMACILIARGLNDRGIPAPRGNNRKGWDRLWCSVSVKSIIENPCYYGARVYNRNSMSKIRAKQEGRRVGQYINRPHFMNDRKDWVLTENAHAPIVNKALWEKANSFLKAGHQPSPGRSWHRSPYLLTGLIRCSRCGYAFQGWSGKARGISYHKYIDGGWQNKRVCSHLGIDSATLENFIVNAIKDTISTPTVVQKIEDALKELLQSDNGNIRDEAERVKLQICENEDKVSNLTGAIERGGGSESVFKRLQEIEQEQASLRIRLGRLQKEAVGSAMDIPGTAQAVADFILNFEENFQKAPIEERKLLIRRMISEIIVDRDEGVVKCHVRSLPTVTPDLEKLLQNKKTPTDVVSVSSSGGPKQ